MTVNEEILQFLEKPEYLRLALDVERRMPEVRGRLLKKFWTTVIDDLRGRLAGLPADAGSSVWQVYEPEKWNDIEQDCFHIRIAPAQTFLSHRQWHVEFPLQQEKEKLFIGVSINRWKDEKFQGNMRPVSKTLADLSRKLRQAGLKAENAYWLGWRNVYEVPLEKTDSLCRIAEDGSFAQEMSGELWGLFDEYRDVARAVNQKLRSA